MVITGAVRHQHHFEDLSPDDFERLVYWLVRRSGDFEEVEWCGGPQDKGRDVVAYRRTNGGREKWYIQCKRYERIWFSTLRGELEKLAEHARNTPEFAPDVIVFATTSRVPARVKDKARDYARELGLPELYYWGRLELDERLKAQPETEGEFFRVARVASQYVPVPPAETEVEVLSEGMPRRLKVFLCHASGDKPAVRELYHRLYGAGFDPWLDEDRLLGGQNWDLEIRRAVRSSDAVIICLSHKAITKAGYVHKEMKYALDVADEQPEGAIFLIPLRLEECEVPERLRALQWVNLFQEDGYKRLLGALRTRAESLGLAAHLFEPETVLIRAGEFLMGSDVGKDKEAEDDEQPQHKLYLGDYHIARTPVTNVQYAPFVQATFRQPPEHWEGGKPPRGKEHHPVVYVSWHDAVAYCNWLAEVTRKPYRLPSEAEWEKGARGTDGRIYPWGDEWDTERCNSEEADIGDTTPVGAYPQGASPYGLLDMAGNTFEWTRSLRGREPQRPDFGYPYDPRDGREDPSAGGYVFWVVRGGAFNTTAGHIRSGYRDKSSPNHRYGNFGFRVVRSAAHP